jgi:hypothetical protein
VVINGNLNASLNSTARGIKAALLEEYGMKILRAPGLRESGWRVEKRFGKHSRNG